MSFALQASRILCRSRAFGRLSSINSCRTLVSSSNSLAKLGTAPQPITTGMTPSIHWSIERVIAVAMLPMYPIAIIFEPMGMEYMVAAAVSLHAYWGFGGVIRDYTMERRYGPKLQPALRFVWQIFCAAGFAGFCYFNYYDVGVIKGVKKLWQF